MRMKKNQNFFCIVQLDGRIIRISCIESLWMMEQLCRLAERVLAADSVHRDMVPSMCCVCSQNAAYWTEGDDD